MGRPHNIRSWDEPLAAMTATRLGNVSAALDLLLLNISRKFYLPSGINHPNATGELSAYFPGNGGVLLAVGMMAGGWEGAPDSVAPGFPPEWGVRVEGFTPYF